jgi:hypothetical protein
MGSGFNKAVFSLIDYNGTLYAGGEFDSSGSTFTGSIAMWNGTDWEMPCEEFFGSCNDFEIFNGKFINTAVIERRDSNGFPWPYWLTVYDTCAQILDSTIGFSGFPRDFQILNGELYLCGDFVGSQGSPIKYITKLVNNDWVYVPHPVCVGLQPGIKAMTTYDNELIVAGTFTTPVGRVARFDGTNYYPLDSGVSGTTARMVIYNNELIVGGYFTHASNIPNTTCLARYSFPTSLASINIPDKKGVAAMLVGADGVISLPVKFQYTTKAELYDLTGRKLADLFIEHRQVALPNLSAGQYLLKTTSSTAQPLLIRIIKTY